MADVLDELTDPELFAALARREQATEAEFMKHVVRVKAARNLKVSAWEPARRNHINDEDGELVAVSWTYILHDDGVVPLLVGTVLREHNHSLLTIVDRSGAAPVVHESTFDTRNFVAHATA